MTNPPVDRFPVLDSLETVLHGFVLRVPGLDVRTDREAALARLEAFHDHVRRGFGARVSRLAQQVHGNSVAIVSMDSPPLSAKVDALITGDPRVLLGIHVADCCAVFLVDPRRRVIGLAHSGKKGSELNVVGETVSAMAAEFGTDPGDLVAQLSPCIRPPHYEVDFATQIVRDLRRSGVRQVFDLGENTATNLEKFYSYRMEKGRTGRMLALLALESA
jgi:copper oxidase (laccase) domain-containing protein